MKAAVWHGRQDVRIQNVAEPPPPSPGQVQVDVAWCGICGTDLHEYVGGPLYIPVDRPHPLTGVQAPVIIGHEMSGTITAVGDGVGTLSPCDRIAACRLIGCGSCRWCQTCAMAQCDRVAFLGTSWPGGALPERLSQNAKQSNRLPTTISDEIGALVEPFSSAVRAVAQGQPGPDDHVAIVGAGPIGLMCIMAARLHGVKHVIAIEMAEQRAAAARDGGAEFVINPISENAEQLSRELTNGNGFDVVLECAGQPSSVLLASKITRTRGRLVIMGVFDKPAAIDLTDVVLSEKHIYGCMSGYGLYEETISMMADPRFRGDLLITDRIGLDSLIDNGYHGLLNEKHKHVKILVHPQ